MVSTKWFQEGDFSEILKIREKVFIEELKCDSSEVSDEYDLFAKKILVLEDNIPVGTGRLIFKNGRYEIDKLCVLREYRRKKYADLLIRMLVRKSIEIGASNTIAFCENKYKNLFTKIGFTMVSNENNIYLMNKKGDIVSHC